MTDPPSRGGGYLFTIPAWILLAGSLFLARADDVFYVVRANMLYQCEWVGPILIVALVLLVPVTLLAVRGSHGAGVAVTVLWLIAFAACVWAAFHLGSHGTDSGEQWNPPAEGTILSLAGAAIGLAAAFFATPDKPLRR